MIRDGARLVERWQALASEGAEVEIAEEMTSVTASIILKAMFSSETMESIHQMKDAVETMISVRRHADDRACGSPLWMPTREEPQVPRGAGARASIDRRAHRAAARHRRGAVARRSAVALDEGA